MGLSERNRGLLAGVAISLGVAAVIRVFGKPLAEVARPLTKAGMRSLLEVREKGEEWLAEKGETLSDIVAEVRAEREAERAESLAAVRVVSSAGEAKGGGV
jgi:hypothetical protein